MWPSEPPSLLLIPGGARLRPLHLEYTGGGDGRLGGEAGEELFIGVKRGAAF